jgi:hypothetical protein
VLLRISSWSFFWDCSHLVVSVSSLPMVRTRRNVWHTCFYASITDHGSIQTRSSISANCEKIANMGRGFRVCDIRLSRLPLVGLDCVQIESSHLDIPAVPVFQHRVVGMCIQVRAIKTPLLAKRQDRPAASSRQPPLCFHWIKVRRLFERSIPTVLR